MTGVCLVLLLYQTSLNISLYSANKRVFTTTIENPKYLQFPPVTVCPILPYDPWGLEELGFNRSSRSNIHLVRNMILLTGVNRQMAGRRFFEAARWCIGRLVEEVSVGNRLEVYDLSATSDLWHQTFSKRRLCYTLRHPAISDHTYSLTIKFRKNFGLVPCTELKNISDTDCDSVKLHCNSSCGMEQIIGTFTTVSLEIPVTTNSKVIYNHPVPELISMGNVTLEQYNVKLSDVTNDYDPEDCVFNCLNKKYFNDEGCKILDNRNLDESLDNLCTLRKLEDRIYYKTISTCYKACPPARHSIHWKMNRHEKGSDYHLRLSFASSQIEAIEEVRVYTLSKLLADIGGNMGLLLGVSLISLLLSCPDYLTLFLRRLRRRDTLHLHRLGSFGNHIRPLSRNSYSYFFLLITSVHLCSFLYLYAYQAEENVISFDQRLCIAGLQDTCTGDTSIEEWVAGHFASRSLGCRVEPPSNYIRCLQKCLVRAVFTLQPDLLPYMITDDILPCDATNRHINRFSYHMPGFIAYESAFAHEEICASECEKESRAINSTFKWPFPRMQKVMPINTVQLFCNIGGIIGLYFGYCLLNIPEMILKVIHFQRKHLRFAIRHLSAFVAGVLGTTICVQQVYVFFYKNPVLTTNSMVRLTSSDIPALTLCPWPPFNLAMLEAYTDGNNETKNLFSLSSEERRDYIESLMDIAQSKNGLPMAWRNMWNHEFNLSCNTIAKGNLRNKHNPVKLSTPFGQCYTCFVSKNEEFNISQVLGFSTDDPSIKDAYLLMHDSNMNPFWSANERTPSAPATLFNIKTVTEFQPYSGNSIDYNSCMSTCLHEMIKSHYDCEVPTLLLNESRHLNISGCSAFLAFLLEDNSSTKEKSHSFSNMWRATCNSTCKQAKFVAYEAEFRRSFFSSDTFQRIGSLQIRLSRGRRSSTGMVRVTKEHKQVMEEFGAYVITQLLSDLGGVGGFTVGISLLTLMLSLVKCSDTLRKHSLSMQE